MNKKSLKWSKVEEIDWDSACLRATFQDMEFDIWEREDMSPLRMLITPNESDQCKPLIRNLHECGLEVWRGDECLFSTERSEELLPSVKLAKQIANAIAKAAR